ncbi:MAG TPA: response regulator [Verrucomicrobiae bacterium]|nr:response regulator [Verrucomicrobiae bacterium]
MNSILTHETILMVEDDENDALLLQRAFAKAGHGDNWRLARDGAQAIDYLSGIGSYADRVAFPMPFLMLLDLKMPGVDGFEVLQWVRKQPELKRLLVVVLTSSNLQKDVDRAYELGANSYLVKPVEFEGTVSLLSRFEAYWAEINRIPTVQRLPEPALAGSSVI